MKKCERCQAIVALKVIHTWASVPGGLVPEHVLSLIKETFEEVKDERGKA